MFRIVHSTHDSICWIALFISAKETILRRSKGTWLQSYWPATGFHGTGHDPKWWISAALRGDSSSLVTYAAYDLPLEIQNTEDVYICAFMCYTYIYI